MEIFCEIINYSFVRLEICQRSLSHCISYSEFHFQCLFSVDNVEQVSLRVQGEGKSLTFNWSRGHTPKMSTVYSV